MMVKSWLAVGSLLAFAHVCSAFLSPASPLSALSATRSTGLLSRVPSSRKFFAPSARKFGARFSSPQAAASSETASSLDPALFAAKSEALASLAPIQDPFRGESIVSLSAVKNLELDLDAGKISFVVELGAPDLKGEVKAACDAAVRELEWVKDVSITMAALPPADEMRSASMQAATGLSKVKNVILCASCKGGVGKSTTAVNFAFTLHEMGYKVGIMDVDVYGPSLPTMAVPDRPFNPEVDIVGNEISPVVCKGVKLMSVGFINPHDSFVLRGAKVSPLVQQLISTTAWGDLDYLIIDMPPGTGDIHLTLSQMESLKIDAAVIVTTPQRLSFVDVVKGVEMFDKVGVPSVAVVENMAYLDTSPLQASVDTFAERHSLSEDAKGELLELVGAGDALFGAGHRQRLAEMWGIVNTFSLPLNGNIAKQGDAGVPYVVQNPDSAPSKVFKELAKSVVEEVRRLKEEPDSTPSIAFDQKTKELVINGKQRMKPVDLRRLCRSPANDPKRVPEDIAPAEMTPLGRYAVQIIWTDGHQSLMPYRAFVDGYDK